MPAEPDDGDPTVADGPSNPAFGHVEMLGGLGNGEETVVGPARRRLVATNRSWPACRLIAGLGGDCLAGCNNRAG
jgi:hypothetical protein